MKYQAINKYALSCKYGISLSSLKKLLNVEYYSQLQEVGYKKYMKILPPKVLSKFIEIHGEPILFLGD